MLPWLIRMSPRDSKVQAGVPAKVTRRKAIAATALIPAVIAGGRLIKRHLREGSAAQSLRPPGAESWEHFLSACIRCTQCIQACPKQCLIPQSASDGIGTVGMPMIEARKNPCDLCQGRDQLECTAACPTPALIDILDRRAVRIGTAEVDPQTCLPFLGIACRACWHSCPLPNDAIRMDELGRPVVVDDQCVGCGLCEHACLAETPAIRVRAWKHDTADS